MDYMIFGLLILLLALTGTITMVLLKRRTKLPVVNNTLKAEKLKKGKKIEKEEIGFPEVEEGIVEEKQKRKGLSWFDKRKLKKHPEKSFLIRMLFSNGTCKEFVIKTNHELFKYKKRWYHLRYENSYFNLTQNQYELTYFDDFVEPLDREVLKEGNKNFWSVTPENVKPIIDMNYVKVLASSQDIDKWLKTTAILSGLVLMGILYIAYQLSEILNRVKP